MPNTPPSNTPPEDEPGVIIISITGDTDPVTGACTVNFQATVPDASQPTLTLSFAELVPNSSNSADYEPITVANPPTVTWSSGVASFSLAMDSAIFNQLSSKHTTFAVMAHIPNVNSQGICTFGIDLP